MDILCEEQDLQCYKPAKNFLQTTVNHLLVYCENHIETRKILGMPDNLFETLSPIQDNTKIITFLKHIDMYNLI